MRADSKRIQILSLKNQSFIADKCFVADCFFARLKGLIGTPRLEAGEGMFFPKCNDIHMWFMSIPLDVVFVRRERALDGSLSWRVTSAHEGVRPWRPLPLRDGKASETIELPVGTIKRCEIRAGDQLCLS